VPRGDLFAGRDLGHQIDDGLVGLESFTGEAGEPAADVVIGERLAATDRASEEALTER
jgi:hypothetical protein